MKQNICPICGGREFTTLFSCKDYLVSHKYFEIIECIDCQMRITKDAPSENEIGTYYESDDYISHSDTQHGIVNTIYHTVRKFMLNKKSHWVIRNSGLKRGRLLDVGSGTGYFPKQMQDKGWTVSAVEVNDVARDFSKQKFDLEVYASLSDFVKNREDNQIRQKLDAITLWHVLEHIENVSETMQTFNNLLSVGGLLVLALPNCDSYDARHYEKDWLAYDVPRHLWHFREEQLRQLGEQYGFELVKTNPMYFDGFYISMMSEKERGDSGSLFKALKVGIIGAVKTLFNKNESSSLVYFLRKRENRTD